MRIVESKIEVKLARKEDIPWIVRHRIEMFRSMGYTDDILSNAQPEIEKFLENDWVDGLRCFLVIEEEIVVGGCAVSIYSRLPNPRKTHGAKIGYIHNLFIEPEYRNRGIATALLLEVITFCKNEGIFKFTLHDTAMSAGIYNRLGFKRVENYYDVWVDPE